MGKRHSKLDQVPKIRGYFGVGCYGISKAANAGAIFRTAHAFGGSFVFTVGAVYDNKQTKLTDTSASMVSMPFYAFPSVEEILLPEHCQIVSVELTDDAVDLPSFRHPSNCVYMFGPERGNIPDSLIERSQHVVKIPTKFCVNVSLAAGLVLYDRLINLGRYAERPLHQKQRSIKHPIIGDDQFETKAQAYISSAPDVINK